MSKLLNIFISIVFLISFIGVQINKHYSQGKLYSVSVFGEAQSCCDDVKTCKMKEMMQSSDHHKHHQAKHKCSCEDKTEFLRLHNVFVSEKFSLPAITSHDLCSNLLPNLVETNLFATVSSSPIKHSWPPPSDNNFQAEFGVFLC